MNKIGFIGVGNMGYAMIKVYSHIKTKKKYSLMISRKKELNGLITI